MGYSIFTLFETEADRDRMAKFLEQEFRPLSDIVSSPSSEDMQLTDSHPPHTDLAYTGDYSGPWLGYNYGAGDSDIERSYRFALCYWMAVISGIEINGFKSVVYDGDELWSVCTGGERCEQDPTCIATIHTDQFGRRKLSQLIIVEKMNAGGTDLDDYVNELTTINRNVQQELHRLSTVWNNNQKS